MYKHPYRVFGRKTLRSIVIVLGSMSVAFTIGVQTAGDVHPISETRADSATVRGDMNGDGSVDARDASLALEISQGYRSATEQEIAADPSQDFRITLDDVQAILRTIEFAAGQR